MQVSGFSNCYSSDINDNNKRERNQELPEPLALFLKKVAVYEEAESDSSDEEFEREVHQVSLKRDRKDEDDQPVDDNTLLKKRNNVAQDSLVQEVLNSFGKRSREESTDDMSLDELLKNADEYPVIEEIPEDVSIAEPSDTVKIDRLALQIFCPESAKTQFLRMCATGEIPSIKKYIIENRFLLVDLNCGVLAIDHSVNDLIDGFNTAILHNKSDVVDFFLKLPALRKNVHAFQNLSLKLALAHNRVAIICRLLQIPDVLCSITTTLLKDNITLCASNGWLFQFLLISCLPRAGQALKELGYNNNYNSLIDLLHECAARFPKSATAVKEFIEADFIQVSDDGPIMMLKKNLVLYLLKQAAIILQKNDDLPDISSLNLN